MASQIGVSFRINKELKEDFEAFCDSVGLSMSTAIILFIKTAHPVLAFLCFLLSYCIMYVFNTKYKSNIELILRSILLETVFKNIKEQV